MPEIRCGETGCGSPMRLIEGKYGKFYGCVRYPVCSGVHSAHQNSGKPMGIPANRETIEWRKKAHAKFDPYVKQWFRNRREGYAFLQNVMGLSAKDAHISKFNIEQCQKLIEILDRKH